MTEQEAKKAVKEDIEAIAKASDDQEDKLTAMLVGFSDLLVNQTIDEYKGEASEKELAICAMAGLIKTLIDYDKLDEGTVYAMFVKLKMGKDAAKHYVFDGFCF